MPRIRLLVRPGELHSQPVWGALHLGNMSSYTLICVVLVCAVMGALLIVRLNQAALAQACAICGAIVRASEVRDGACAVCTANQESLIHAKDVCCRCASSEQIARLWDGRGYCRRCIAEWDGDDLLQSRAAETALTARTRVPFIQATIGHATVYVAKMAVVAGIFAAGALLFGQLAAAAEILVAIAVVGSGVCMAFAAAVAWGAMIYPVTVSLRHGIVQVAGCGEFHSAPLAECLWYSGHVCDSTIGLIPWTCRCPCPVLILPKGRRGQRISVPIRDVAETTNAWERFLKLADVRQAGDPAAPFDLDSGH